MLKKYIILSLILSNNNILCSDKKTILNPSNIAIITAGLTAGAIKGCARGERKKYLNNDGYGHNKYFIPNSLALGSLAIFTLTQNKEGMALSGSYLIGEILGYLIKK